MRIGVVKESQGESRVAIVPGSMKKLKKAGFEVVIESGSGVLSNYLDNEYTDAGAEVSTRENALSCPIIISIGLPDISSLNKGQIVACVSDPFRHPDKSKAVLRGGNYITIHGYDSTKAFTCSIYGREFKPRQSSRLQSCFARGSKCCAWNSYDDYIGWDSSSSKGSDYG